MPIKAVITDFDGTFACHKTHSVLPETLELYHQLRREGVEVFIATGRPLKTLMSHCPEEVDVSVGVFNDGVNVVCRDTETVTELQYDVVAYFLKTMPDRCLGVPPTGNLSIEQAPVVTNIAGQSRLRKSITIPESDYLQHKDLARHTICNITLSGVLRSYSTDVFEDDGMTIFYTFGVKNVFVVSKRDILLGMMAGAQKAFFLEEGHDLRIKSIHEHWVRRARRIFPNGCGSPDCVLTSIGHNFDDTLPVGGTVFDAIEPPRKLLKVAQCGQKFFVGCACHVASDVISVVCASGSVEEIQEYNKWISGYKGEIDAILDRAHPNLNLNSSETISTDLPSNDPNSPIDDETAIHSSISPASEFVYPKRFLALNPEMTHPEMILQATGLNILHIRAGATDTKDIGVANLIARLGLRPDEILVLGDGDNDEEMIERFPYSVGMSHGTEKLKASAKWVADSWANGVKIALHETNGRQIC